MKLAWGNAVSEGFRQHVLAICDAFGWSDAHASWLMACMHFETGGRFSPTVLNAAGSGAIGLIQFMPRTASGLGTSTAQLASMTATQQLDWVEAYFKPYAHRIGSLSDMYMAILLPSAIGKPEDAVLFSGGTAYRQNSALDANSDGRITKGEATVRVRTSLDMGLRPENLAEVTRPGPTPPKEEPPMDPLSTKIIETAIPSIWNAIPEFVNIFKQPDVATRNVEAVQKLGQIMIDSTQAANAQDAVTKIKTDPAAAAAANQAIRMSRADFMDMLSGVAGLDQKSTDSARAFNEAEPFMIETKVLKLKFWHVMALLVTVFFLVVVAVVAIKSTNASERMMVFQALIGAFLLIMGFIFGSSYGSKVKDFFRVNQ